jgi:hypothetical protein
MPKDIRPKVKAASKRAIYNLPSKFVFKSFHPQEKKHFLIDCISHKRERRQISRTSEDNKKKIKWARKNKNNFSSSPRRRNSVKFIVSFIVRNFPSAQYKQQISYNNEPKISIEKDSQVDFSVAHGDDALSIWIDGISPTHTHNIHTHMFGFLRHFNLHVNELEIVNQFAFRYTLMPCRYHEQKRDGNPYWA